MKQLVRPVIMWCLILLAGAFALVALRGPNGVAALAHKRKVIQTMQEQNATLAADNDRRRQRIERLKYDRVEQERLVRERWKVIRPNETEIVIQEPAAQ